ncbi:MAG: glucosamine inositolphosphorylceramide transferase family protein [Gammaproteobacteria bacterium]
MNQSEQSGKKKLRVGLLVDSFRQPAWAYAMLERIHRSEYAEIVLVVLNESSSVQEDHPDGVHGDRKYWLFNLYCKIDRWLFQPARDAFAMRDTASLLSGVPVISVGPKQVKYKDIIEPMDIAEIRKHEVDVFVRLGFRILSGEILSTPKFGVWSYHHGDSAVLRGGPAGFWEVFEKQSVTGTTLQFLTEDLDKGVVLGKTFSSTDMLSVARNRSNYYWNALSLLPRKLRKLHELGGEIFWSMVTAENRTVEYSPALRRRPENRDFFWLFVKKFAALMRFKLRKLFFLNQWILMYDLDKGISGPLTNFKKIIPPKDRLWADPFVLYKSNQYFIFLEEMKFKEKGHISLIIMDEQGRHGLPVKVLEKPYHLSYPFILEWQGDYYMIPESTANKTVDVYKCTHFPDKWEFHNTLLNNVRAADTTVVSYQDKWWLFANIQENEGASNWEELFLFYADSPLSDQWIAHPQNPIVSDVRRARPAGNVFLRNGKLYRPAQDCSKTYGYGMRINEIVTMNEYEYKEVEVRFIEPDWADDIKGVHTLNVAHKLTVIDAIYKRPYYWFKR